MAQLEAGGKRFPIPVGEAVLGREASAAIPLEGEGALPRHAVLQGLPDGQVVIRKAVPQADVTINGVRLGAEPTPLLHGDKIELAGREFTFVDERRSGSTQYIEAVKLERGGPAAAAREGQTTANTGGRVVCLTDGREYQITGQALVFGRDATNDVVVPGRDVSRRHAEIIQSPRGYLLVDSSTNGTFVNEQRIEGQRLLVRADIVRIGDEQFRFYADLAPAPAAPEPRAPSPPPAGATQRLKDTMHGLPPGAASPQAPAAAPLASFLVRAGALKGQRLAVRSPVVNIGRAEYNDVIFPDPSVSTAHAKLQRREGVWVLIDLDSTNGTFVDEERVKGEAGVSPGASVRFGDVAVVFEPADEGVAVAKGGGTQLIRGLEPTAAPAAPPTPSSPPAPSPSPPKASPAPPKTRPKRPVAVAPPGKAAAATQKQGKGCGSSAAAFCLAAAALVYWVLVS